MNSGTTKKNIEVVKNSTKKKQEVIAPFCSSISNKCAQEVELLHLDLFILNLTEKTSNFQLAITDKKND